MSSLTELLGAGLAPPAQTLSLIIDTLAWPLLMLSRDGTLVHANRAGQRLLARRRPLLLAARGVVQPADPARRDAYQAALAAAASGRRNRAPDMLQWASPGRHDVLSVTALYGPAKDHPLLLLALCPEPAERADLHAYAAINGLSEAETRVLLHLARGDSSVQAAAELGVSPATVRSQTVALRRKTGHASVAALLRTLAALPPLRLDDDGEK